ncbi:MAG: 3-dehydroquinate synthase [Deltaproteobacteria bacterium]|nr:3-dehydroquinate synthase [Deltaproteobacteria bacterium]
MHSLEIKGSLKVSRLYVGESYKNVEKYLPSSSVVIIADSNVYDLYHDTFPKYKTIKINTNERMKSLDTVDHIINELVTMEADRSLFLLGIGGGILCDITGFVASIYMRGVSFGFVSTTLLSQVDASVGGKNGVNFKGYKNIIGVFNQPDFVVCDPQILKTLPKDELLNGCAEIIKHGVIADKKLFEYLENNYQGILNMHPEVIERVVYDSVVIKSDIVNRDEKEKGERRKLNFGHTVGHAIEKVTGVSHGKAVSLGMVAAANLSQTKGLLSADDKIRIISLLKNMGLPTEMDADKEKILDAMKRDKKREGESIHFVLLDGIGKAVIKNITISELEGYFL